tara:strand:- start:1120 stop:1851 length:732 start_codon:yes stop_codon:yes gene_type:complete
MINKILQKKINIKIVILCGGEGSRLGVDTAAIPKPMVKIDKDPIIVHIMRIFKRQGFNDFILASGYKGQVIKKYFKKNKEFKVKVIDTGLKSLTGTRLKKLKKYLINEDQFVVTYGDGVANINLNNLINFHLNHKKEATMTVVRPPVRFGEVKMRNGTITNFEEKPQIKNNWINGGFFIFNKNIFKYFSKNNEMLEKKPIQKMTKAKKIMGFQHKGFWQCMDTQRDKKYLQSLIKQNKALWLK